MMRDAMRNVLYIPLNRTRAMVATLFVQRHTHSLRTEAPWEWEARILSWLTFRPSMMAPRLDCNVLILSQECPKSLIRTGPSLFNRSYRALMSAFAPKFTLLLQPAVNFEKPAISSSCSAKTFVRSQVPSGI